MYRRNRIIFAFVSALFMGAGPVGAQDTPSANDELQLSPEVLELLRAEMRALSSGVQSLSVAIATGDWKSVAKTGAQISASYILDQELTPVQKKELGRSLPEHFKRMDAQFHQEASKLEAAAMHHDAQLAAFHYYRLLETCTACHSLYAPARFPGFAAAAGRAHDH